MRAEYAEGLRELAALLRERPRTVREIATALKCCKVTAYKRLRDLIGNGEAVFTVKPARKVDQGRRPTGPRALIYGIRDRD